MLDRYVTDALARGLNPSTVQMYRGRLEVLQHRHGDLQQVTLEDLRAFFAARRETHAAETRKTFRSAFRSYYQWAVEEGVVDDDPSVRLKPVPIPVAVPSIADDESVQLGLIGAPLDEAAMILLARMGCLRLSEITTLRKRHRERDLLRITGKGEKQRLVPANDLLLRTLSELEEYVDDYYFEGLNGPHCHKDHVYRVIKRRTGWNPHALRHAGATAAYNATQDLRAVQLLLGHSSMATTQRYLHIGLQQVRVAAAGTAFTSNVIPLHYPSASMPRAA